MKRLTTSTAALAALVALAAGASADIDRTAFAARYAAFKQEQTQRWAWGGLLGGPVSNFVTRLLRYKIRLTAGEINPTNMPVFGDDIHSRQAALDELIGITDAHATATGHDVVVAVLDSGFNLAHPWISSRVLPYGYDAVGHDWDPTDRGNGVDDDGDDVVDGGVGHGTFVAGMVVSVAPESWILPVRIADDEGLGLEEELLSGIDFAIAMGVDVINISFEAGTITLGVRDKLRDARDAGIAVVVSCGNDGSTHAKTLANEGTTISVGATDDDDEIAAFSNAPSDGEGITVFAPGVDLYGPHGGPTNTTSCTWSGTSFSAPLASGAVALALERVPARTPSQLRDVLRASVVSVTTQSGAAYTHAGRIDLRLVVQQ